ncbi:hypothetical protein DM860_015752 [Cuscuta australis]|uniref:Uncharacterized protein n=1 Tax=Cuscuta australis TaxID=267555 RepID=A0A328DQM1_9ASTE|nr:hypothetical protein DM860_015752 [Cuscuta australis]
MTSQRRPIMLSCDDISNVQHSEFLDANRTRMITTLKNTTENLIEAFGESKDDHLEQDVDAITDSTLNKRLKDVEHCHGVGDDSSKKMKNIKIEKD